MNKKDMEKLLNDIDNKKEDGVSILINSIMQAFADGGNKEAKVALTTKEIHNELHELHKKTLFEEYSDDKLEFIINNLNMIKRILDNIKETVEEENENTK